MSSAAKKRHREIPEVRRSQILDEAIRLIGTLGYRGFSIQEVAWHCGIAKGTLFYYFRSKAGLLMAVLEERDRRIADAIPVELVSPSTGAKPRKQVRQTLCDAMKRAALQPELQRLYVTLQSEAMKPDHPAHVYIVDHQSRILEGLAAMIAPHVPRPEVSARHLLALMEGLVQQWLRSDDSFDLGANWKSALMMVLPD